MMSDIVEVTQADRDCMADVISDMELMSELSIGHFRSGLYDNDCRIVATHRAQAIADLTAEITRLNQEIDALHAEIGHRKASVVDREAVIRECARIARDGCLVPPDGGSPTEAEADLCDHISAQILALIEQEGK